MSVAGVSSNNTYNSGGMSYAATAKTDKKKNQIAEEIQRLERLEV